VLKPHDNKMVNNHVSKDVVAGQLATMSDRARRAAELRILEHELTGQEADQVGRVVQLAAERAADKWRDGIRAAMTPTPEELAAEAAALAEWETASKEVAVHRRAGAEAQRRAYEAIATGDRRAADRQEAARVAADSRMKTALTRLELASGEVGRVRGQNDANANRRRAEVIRGWSR
jgi:hypothetical protein